MVEGRRRKKTPRFLEISQLAGVSPSTVDRVLNERGSVSASAREKVVGAAKQLGVPRVLPQTRHGLIHIDVLLPANHTPFFRRMNLALQRSIGMLDKRVVVHRAFLPEHKNDVIADAILRPPYKRQGLILAAPDTEPVRQALRTIIEHGEAAVAVVTNILEVPALKYAGIDNHRAGRAAGYFIGRFTQRHGRVLILSSRTDYQGHVDRTAGCRETLAQYAPRLYCDTRTVETYDDPDRCYLAVSSALKSGEPIAGIYNSGAGSPGIEAALKKHGADERICWITHEMSDDHREYIRAGLLDMVVDQDPDGQIMTALQHLLHAAQVSESAEPPNAPTEFRLYFAENIRETPYLP
ncbi:MAG: LacI family DNA-binding transcriptional regulator [Propionivibrio sp.]